MHNRRITGTHLYSLYSKKYELRKTTQPYTNGYYAILYYHSSRIFYMMPFFLRVAVRAYAWTLRRYPACSLHLRAYEGTLYTFYTFTNIFRIILCETNRDSFSYKIKNNTYILRWVDKLLKIKTSIPYWSLLES